MKMNRMGMVLGGQSADTRQRARQSAIPTVASSGIGGIDGRHVLLRNSRSAGRRFATTVAAALAAMIPMVIFSLAPAVAVAQTTPTATSLEISLSTSIDIEPGITTIGLSYTVRDNEDNVISAPSADGSFFSTFTVTTVLPDGRIISDGVTDLSTGVLQSAQQSFEHVLRTAPQGPATLWVEGELKSEFGGGTLVASATITVEVRATQLELSPSSSTVMATDPFLVTVVAVDDLGNEDPDYVLDSSALVAQDTVRGFEVSTPLISVVPGSNNLQFTIVGANDNDPHKISLVDSGGSVVLSGEFTVAVDVVAATLQVVGQDVIPDVDNTFTIQAVDIAGNRDRSVLLFTQALQISISSGSGTVELAGPPLTGSQGIEQLRLRFSGLPGDGESFSLTIEDAGLSGTAEFKVDVLTRALLLDVPADVTAGQSFGIEVQGVDSAGSVDVGYVVSHNVQADVQALLSPAGVTFSATRVGLDRVDITVLSVQDNSELTITLSDGNASGVATVPVRVVGTALAMRAPALVAAGRSFDIEVTFVDEQGNLDEDRLFELTSSSAAIVISDGDAQGASSVRSDGGSGAQVQLSQGTDGSTFTLTATYQESSQQLLSVANSLEIGIIPDYLTVAAPQVMVPGVTYTISVGFFDNNDNAAPKAQLSDGVQLSGTDSSSRAITFASVRRVSGNRALEVVVEQAVDNSAVILTVSDTQEVSGTISGNSDAVTIEVEGSMLRLQPDGDLEFSSASVVVLAGRAFALTVEAVDGYGNIDVDIGLSAASQVSGTGVVLSAAVQSPTELSVTIEQAVDHASSTLSVVVGALSGSAAVDIEVWADHIEASFIPTSTATLTVDSLVAAEGFGLLEVQYLDANGNLDLDLSWGGQAIVLDDPATVAGLDVSLAGAPGHYIYPTTAHVSFSTTHSGAGAGKQFLPLERALDNQLFGVGFYDNSLATLAAIASGTLSLSGRTTDITALVVANQVQLSVENVPLGLHSTDTRVVGTGLGNDPFIVRSDLPFEVVWQSIDSFGNIDVDRPLTSTSSLLFYTQDGSTQPYGYLANSPLNVGQLPHTGGLGEIDVASYSDKDGDSERLSVTLGVTADGLHVYLQADIDGLIGGVTVSVDIVATGLWVADSVTQPAEPRSLSVGAGPAAQLQPQRVVVLGVGARADETRIDLDYSLNAADLRLAVVGLAEAKVAFSIASSPTSAVLLLQDIYLLGTLLPAGIDNSTQTVTIRDAGFGFQTSLYYDHVAVVGERLELSAPSPSGLRPGEVFSVLPVAVDSAGNVDEDYRPSQSSLSVTVMQQSDGDTVPLPVVVVGTSTATDSVRLRLGQSLNVVDNSTLTLTVSDTLYYNFRHFEVSTPLVSVLSHTVSGQVNSRINIVATRLSVVDPPAVVHAGVGFSLVIEPTDIYNNVDADIAAFAISSTTTLSVANPHTPLAQPSGHLGQISLTSGDITIQVANDPAVNNGALATLLTGDDGELFTLQFSQGDLEGRVQIEIGLIAELMRLSAPAEVVATRRFDITASFFDAVGNAATGHQLSAAAQVVSLSPGVSISLLYVSTNVLTVRLSEAVDNSTATISVSDVGLLGELRGETEVLVRVHFSGFEVSAPSPVTVLEPFDVAVVFEDAAGNIDVDAKLPSTATVQVRDSLSSSANIVVNSISTTTLSVTLLRGIDNTTVTFDVGAHYLELVDATVAVRVVGTALLASAPSLVTPDTPFLVEVGFVDANGNIDEDLYYLAEAVDTTLTVTVLATLLDTSPNQAGPMVTVQDAVLDGQLIDILVERSGFLSDTLSVTMDVQALALSISAPSTGTVGTAFTVDVQGVDAYGNIDEDFALSPLSRNLSFNAFDGQGVAISTSEYSFARATDRSLWVNIHVFDDTTTAVLSLDDGALLGLSAVDVLMDVLADRLAISGSNALITGRPYKFQYTATDANGNRDTDYNVAATEVALSISRNAEISISTANGSFEVIRAIDGAAVTFTAGAGQLVGSHHAEIYVTSSKLYATALSNILIPGLGVGISYVGLDTYDNVDLDSDSEQVLLEVVDSTGAASIGYAVFDSFVLLYATDATDGAEVSVRLNIDDLLGEVSGELEPGNVLHFTVDVVATRIDINAPLVISPGDVAQINYLLYDHIGNVDTDGGQVSLTLENFNGSYTFISDNTSSNLVVTQATDGETLRLVASSGGISAIAEILVDVQADQLRLQLPAAAYISDPFVFSLDAVDGYGNIDSSWRISSSVVLDNSTGSLFYFGPRRSDGAMAAIISDLSYSTSVVVVATDGSLTGSDVISMRESGDFRDVVGLKLSLPDSPSGALRTASTVTLLVNGIDEGGLVDPAWRPGSSLTISIAGDPDALRSRILLNGEVQIQLLQAIDNSRLTLVATYPEISTGILTVSADVRSEYLSFDSTNYVLVPGDGPVSLSTLSGVDSRGNIDADYSAPVSGRIEEVARTGGELAIELVDTLSLALSSNQVDDGATVEFRYIDTSNPAAEIISLALFVTVDVQPVDLALVLDGDGGTEVVVGDTFRVVGGLQDSYGNIDLDTAYTLSPVAAQSLSVQPASVVANTAYSNGGLLITLLQATDQATINLSLTDGILTAQLDLLADVVADQLAVQMPAVVVAGQRVSGRLQAVDRLGNVDTDSAIDVSGRPVVLAGLSTPHASISEAAGGFIDPVVDASGAFELLIYAGNDRQVLQIESLADGAYPLSGSTTFVFDVVADHLYLSGPADIREGVAYDVVFLPVSTYGDVDIDLLPVVTNSSGVLVLRPDIVAPSAILALSSSVLSVQSSATAVFDLLVTPSSTGTDVVRFTLQLPGDVDIVAAINSTSTLAIDYAGFGVVLTPQAQPAVLLNLDGAGQGLSVSDALLIARVLTLDSETLDSDPGKVIDGYNDLTVADAVQIIADVRNEVETNPDLLDINSDGVVDEIDGAYLTTYLGIPEEYRAQYANFTLRNTYGIDSTMADAVIDKIETLIATVVE